MSHFIEGPRWAAGFHIYLLKIKGFNKPDKPACLAGEPAMAGRGFYLRRT